MSYWNTLHLFDSKKFDKEIAPELITGGKILDAYFKSKLYLYLTRIQEFENSELIKLKLFLNNFDNNFMFHNELYSIQNRKKRDDEKYEEFIKEKYKNENEFLDKYCNEIDNFSKIIPLIMFSECAQFNPHLILGRRIFQSSISVTKKSIAEECYNKINTFRIGGIYGDTGNITNWLTYEEVKILWLDIQNVFPTEEKNKQYFDDFKNFLKIAFENELGLLSVSNINETILKTIENPKLKIEVNLDRMNFVNVINHL